MPFGSSTLNCVLGLALSPVIVAAPDRCAPKDSDICTQAKQFAHALAPQLPMALNSNLTIQTVLADGPSIGIISQLKCGRERLNEVLQSVGPTDAQMVAILKRVAEGSVCGVDSSATTFVSQGGQVRYVYKFNDGSQYTTVLIDSCQGA
jgi:hypothetical protein